MANNGYSLGSVCTSSIYDKALSVCPSPPTAGFFLYSGNVQGPTGGMGGNCYSLCQSGSGWCSYYTVEVKSFDCEIPGPPLTETQQIEAINGLFPHAVAILAIAWGLRYIRVLVAEWLKERNASD